MYSVIIVFKYILLIGIAVMIPIKLTTYLYEKKNIILNRWIYGVSAFLIVIVPQVIFINLSKNIVLMLYVAFFFLVMMFFETSRINVEKKKLKTMFDYTWLAKKTIKKNINGGKL
ncbi:hypothetical protein [Clostridium uliginosum]|uniref:Uncharacterized protein n=1 Tax=Clostridium uliginosum TaxID=119641 RepID=A0A1I1MZW4_9CLOT|nr:hypothetical protein [Clostridium uliginosum]SFC90646.1 hypothetical protein SAMN05421842_11316 [Clostridium uliginosum]